MKKLLVPIGMLIVLVIAGAVIFAAASARTNQGAVVITTTTASTSVPRPIPSDQFARIHKGMTEPEVVDIVGSPISGTRSADGKTVEYDCGPVVLCAVTYNHGEVVGVLDSRVGAK